LQVNMMVNYDLPLMYEGNSGGGGEGGRFDKPGIKTSPVSRRTFTVSEQIEKTTGRKILRIETNDVDEMEEVCLLPSFFHIEEYAVPTTMF
ncbi:hypothetical protein K438DRAFT_1635543, partial [Mycena galopus ATCC 62051]